MTTQNLIAVGRKYKQFTINKLYTKQTKRSRCQCRCACGNIVDVYCDELVSGRKASCHEPKPKFLSGDDLTLMLEEALDLNTTIRVIQRYIKYGMSFQQRIARHKELSKSKVPDSIDDLEIGDTVSHFTLMEKSVFEGAYHRSYHVMSSFLCECGKVIYVSDTAIKKHNHLRCTCDVHMDNYLSRLKIARSTFDLNICRHGQLKEGCCVHYNGDDGCLADIAMRRLNQPIQYLPEYKCYQCSDDKTIRGCSSGLIRGVSHRHLFEG